MPPISEFYASTVVKVKVDFSLAGFSGAPASVTSALGVEPDWHLEKGDTWITSWGQTRTAAENSWGLESRTDSKDANDHLRELLNRLASRRGAFRPEWGEPSFGILWKGNYLYAGSGPFYEADVLEGVAELGAAIWQDIYQVDQEGGAEVDELSRIPKRFFSGGA